MNKNLIGNFILRYFIGLIADRQAENKAKAGKCEHMKWGRWILVNDSLGVLIQKRVCRRCGWFEFETTEFAYDDKMKDRIDKCVAESIDRLITKSRENQNDKT